ncbi:MAG: GNAT family N-acetyltransferase [Crocinitomicaceae bacterium]
MKFTLISPISGQPSSLSNEKIVSFLYQHLDEYGDKKNEILNCLDYALNPETLGKGFVLAAHNDEEIRGCVVINETGMSGYIPENILVYIAVHKQARGEGLGKRLMEHALKLTKGDVALHVEKENPARFLYEKMGFTNPYLEMRLKR